MRPGSTWEMIYSLPEKLLCNMLAIQQHQPSLLVFQLSQICWHQACCTVVSGASSDIRQATTQDPYQEPELHETMLKSSWH